MDKGKVGPMPPSRDAVVLHDYISGTDHDTWGEGVGVKEGCEEVGSGRAGRGRTERSCNKHPKLENCQIKLECKQDNSVCKYNTEYGENVIISKFI